MTAQADLMPTTSVPGQTTPQCPLCGAFMLVPEVRNSLSRYVPEYICNQCGMSEALFNLAARGEARTVLYFDGSGNGVVMVTEDQPGYYTWAPHPLADEQWVRNYVDAVNERHDIDVATRNAIVLSSMRATPPATPFGDD